MLALVLLLQIVSIDPQEEAARRFLWANFSALGLENPDTDLQAFTSSRTACGAIAFEYRQKVRGLPVLEGSLVVLVDRHREVTLVRDELLRGFAPKPKLAEKDAIAKTVAAVQARWNRDVRTVPIFPSVAISGTGAASERRLEWTVWVQAHEQMGANLVAIVDDRTGEVRELKVDRQACGGVVDSEAEQR